MAMAQERPQMARDRLQHSALYFQHSTAFSDTGNEEKVLQHFGNILAKIAAKLEGKNQRRAHFCQIQYQTTWPIIDDNDLLIGTYHKYLYQFVMTR